MRSFDRIRKGIAEEVGASGEEISGDPHNEDRREGRAAAI